MSERARLRGARLRAYIKHATIALLRQIKQFHGQLAILTSLSATAALSSYIFTILLARALGPETFGLYSYVMALGSLAVLLIMFDTNHTAPVLAARTGAPQAVIASIYALRLALLGMVILLGLPTIALLRVGGDHWPLVVFGVAVLALPGLNSAFVYEVGARNIRYLLIYFGERALYLAAGLTLLGEGVDTVAPYFVVLAVAVIISLSVQGLDNRKLLSQFSFHPALLGQLLRTNAPLFVVSISTFAYGGLSRLILESKLGLSELGVYSAAWQLIVIGTLFQAQVDRVWRIRIARAAADTDYTALGRLIRSYVLFATGPIVACAVLLAVTAPLIVPLLFTDAYADMVPVLPMLAVYLVVISFDGLARMLWVAAGNRVVYLLITASSAAMTLFTLAILPQGFGLPLFAMVVVAGHGIAVAVLLARMGWRLRRSATSGAVL